MISEILERPVGKRAEERRRIRESYRNRAICANDRSISFPEEVRASSFSRVGF
jgi:hypothetical protein